MTQIITLTDELQRLWAMLTALTMPAYRSLPEPSRGSSDPSPALHDDQREKIVAAMKEILALTDEAWQAASVPPPTPIRAKLMQIASYAAPGNRAVIGAISDAIKVAEKCLPPKPSDKEPPPLLRLRCSDCGATAVFVHPKTGQESECTRCGNLQQEDAQ